MSESKNIMDILECMSVEALAQIQYDINKMIGRKLAENDIEALIYNNKVKFENEGR